jgi:hypothetical protein
MMPEPANDHMVDEKIAAADQWVAAGCKVFPAWWPTKFAPTAAEADCACPPKSSSRNKDGRCESPGKHPIGSLVPHGLSDATADPAIYRQWFQQKPQASVGVVMGPGYITVDLDGPKAVDKIKAEGVEMPHTAISKTGRAEGGWHYIYTTPVPISPTADLFGDGSKVDLRGPGSYIIVAPSLHYTGSRYEQITPISDAVEAPAWIAKRRLRVVTIDDASDGPVEQKMWREGGRDNQMRDMIWKTRQSQPSLSENALFAAVWADHNDQTRWEGNFDPLDEDRVRYMVRKAISKPITASATASVDVAAAIGATDENGEVERKRIRLSEFIALQFPDEKYRVDDLMPLEGMVAIVGAEKVGKSMLMLQMALCIATGQPFLGKETVQCPVLFIEEEGSARALHWRTGAQSESLGIDPRDSDIPLYIYQRERFRLDDVESVRFLESEIVATGAKVVLMGPLAQLASVENENDAKEFNAIARTLVTLAVKHSVVFALAHHRRKDDSKKGPPNSITGVFASTRGSSALMAAVDGGIAILRDPEMPDGTLFVLQRDGEAYRIFVSFDKDGLIFKVDESDRMSVDEKQHKALDFLRSKPGEWFSTNAVAGAVKVRDTTIKSRLEDLKTQGLIDTRTGARGATEWRALNENEVAVGLAERFSGGGDE